MVSLFFADLEITPIGIMTMRSRISMQLIDAEESRIAGWRRPSRQSKGRVKQEWMRKFNDKVSEEKPETARRQDYWDTATHLYNKGNTPDEAADKVMKLSSWMGTPKPREGESVILKGRKVSDGKKKGVSVRYTFRVSFTLKSLDGYSVEQANAFAEEAVKRSEALEKALDKDNITDKKIQVWVKNPEGRKVGKRIAYTVYVNAVAK